MKPHRGRIWANRLALSLATASALFGLTLLAIILFDIVKHGLSSMNWALLTEDPAGPMGGGGLKGAFLGQAMLTLVATLVGAPVGILAGTYLAEYGRGKKISKVCLSLCDLAMSLPSIVVGIFVYSILVKPFGGFNGWAGSAALAIIMIPLVTRTTESMLTMVPWTLREAALALGSPYHQVIIKVVYRKAASGLLTGVLLAIARIAGETAPLMFTSFNNNYFELNMSRPVPSVTVSVYQYAGSPYEAWIGQAWAAALVVTVVVLFLNILGRLTVKWKS
ncbi:MAG: phosphate ABC transporter permease PstA [Deltaproteobacteria bacterium]|jgi:phosphate transport system permease protein|nr:phosphate ABC transporter permease PstA [Deltaproteobacteria bacterium]